MEEALKLRWRPSAADEFNQILDYIAERDPSAAERLEEAVHACAARLAEHPHLYRPGRVEGTREAVAHPNYLLIHRVSGETVEIISVVHARQEYP